MYIVWWQYITPSVILFTINCIYWFYNAAKSIHSQDYYLYHAFLAYVTSAMSTVILDYRLFHTFYNVKKIP